MNRRPDLSAQGSHPMSAHHPVHGWNSGNCGLVALANSGWQPSPGWRKGLMVDLRRGGQLYRCPPAKIGLGGVSRSRRLAVRACSSALNSMRMNMVDWAGRCRCPRLACGSTQPSLVMSSGRACNGRKVARRAGNDMDGVIVGLCAGGASAVTFPDWAAAGVARAERCGVFPRVQSR